MRLKLSFKQFISNPIAITDMESVHTLTVTDPLCLYRSPVSAARSDDFPIPTAPTTPTSSPCLTVRSIFFRQAGLSFSQENVQPFTCRAASVNRQYGIRQLGWES